MIRTYTKANVTWVCHTLKHVKSKGLFFGGNPFNAALPVLYAQLILSALFTAFLQLILTPLGESAFISQMLVGIALGPTCFGKDSPFERTIFPVESFYTSNTISYFGCMLFMFLVGVKMDMSMVTRSGNKALVIGLSAFFVPVILNIVFALTLKKKINMELDLHNSIVSVAIFQSTSSFYVIACLLADLKLLNSELGRLAVSSSMISGICSWTWLVIAFAIRQDSLGKTHSVLWTAGSMAGMLIVIIFVLRPIMLWMVRETAVGKPVRQNHIFSIFLMVLLCALFGEIIGRHFMIGPMILGLVLPDGPPLGSAIVSKLESFVTSIFLPSYFVFSCARINLTSVHFSTAAIVVVLALSSFVGKLMGTVLPSLYCRMSVVDSISLGLIMSAQGITDILIIQTGFRLRLIDEESYSVMVVSTVVMTAIITPIVKLLYNPSRKYICTKKRRTIQHTMPNTEFRLLACIYKQENTPSMIHLLEISNPTPTSRISFYIVHLIQLLGRSSPLLIAHQPNKRDSHTNQSDRIINAFESYEQHNYDRVTVNAFTAIAPYETMHDEVCTLAVHKRTAMVIVPFHKHYWRAHRMEETDNHIRKVNLNILRKAPCSIGILVDRETLTGSGSTNSMRSGVSYSIAMVFVEGPDDREALAYAIRMAAHPNVGLTVMRFVESNRKSKNLVSRELDNDLINHFKIANIRSKDHVYKEEFVKDSVEMIKLIRELENLHDLILVGRRHASSSRLLAGLTLWNEFPELGYIGNMLSSSGSNCGVSVLVVQQQNFSVEDKSLAL